MRKITLICSKELGSFLTTPMAYIVVAIFIGLSGAAFTTYLAQTSYSDTSIRGFLQAAQFLILLFSALLTMRLISEERKLGTWELLLTAHVVRYELLPTFVVVSYEVLSIASVVSYELLPAFVVVSYEPLPTFGVVNYEPLPTFGVVSYEVLSTSPATQATSCSRPPAP